MQRLVEAPLQRVKSGIEGEGVIRKSPRITTVQIPGQLIEHEDKGERASGRGSPVFECPGGCLVGQFPEPAPNFLVESPLLANQRADWKPSASSDRVASPNQNSRTSRASTGSSSWPAGPKVSAFNSPLPLHEAREHDSPYSHPE